MIQYIGNWKIEKIFFIKMGLICKSVAGII